MIDKCIDILLFEGRRFLVEFLEVDVLIKYIFDTREVCVWSGRVYLEMGVKVYLSSLAIKCPCCEVAYSSIITSIV